MTSFGRRSRTEGLAFRLSPHGQRRCPGNGSWLRAYQCLSPNWKNWFENLSAGDSDVQVDAIGPVAALFYPESRGLEATSNKRGLQEIGWKFPFPPVGQVLALPGVAPSQEFLAGRGQQLSAVERT